jgi:hypothetical protein
MAECVHVSQAEGAGKSILIMNVPRLPARTPPALPRPSLSRPKPLDELKIDTDGDAVADIAYRVRFAPGQGGRQTAIVRRIDGPQAARSGDGGLL